MPVAAEPQRSSRLRDPLRDIEVARGTLILIAAALFVWLSLTNRWAPLSQLAVGTGPFLERIMVVNVYLVVFNLIPAFLMDGGRVLDALLASRMDYLKATRIPAGLGQGPAFVFGFTGLFTSPHPVFIASYGSARRQKANAVRMNRRAPARRSGRRCSPRSRYLDLPIPGRCRQLDFVGVATGLSGRGTVSCGWHPEPSRLARCIGPAPARSSRDLNHAPRFPECRSRRNA